MDEVTSIMKERFDYIATAHNYLPRTPQKRPKRYTKHLDWLYQHQRYKRSYAAISEKELMISVRAVQQACKRLAKEMDLIQLPIRRK